MSNERLQIIVPKDKAKQLKKLAEGKFISTSAFLRTIVLEWLQQNK